MDAPFEQPRRTAPRRNPLPQAASALWQALRRVAEPLHRAYIACLFQGRTWIILSALATSGLFGAVVCTLYQMQVVAPRSQPAVSSNRQIEYFAEPRARRGAIYDRHGMDHPLAISVASWIVYADSHEITDDTRADIYQRLAALNAFDEKRLFEAIAKTQGRYNVFGEIVDEDVCRRIKADPLLARCIGCNEVSRRIYPLGSQMCHIIGVVNAEGVGADGLEMTLEEHLAGKHGFIHSFKDNTRREIPSKRDLHIPPVDGADVFLTLDQNIQHFAETALDDAMAETAAQAAWTIVMDVKTGDILAMASRPNFDPARYGKADPLSKWNRAIFTNYEPGSTMKGITFAAGINEGAFRTNSLVNCDNVPYAGRLLSDHVRGDITLTVATQKSSNRGASRVAMALGRYTMESYLKEFGFGRKTCIDLPGEGTGIMTPAQKWSELQSIRIAIGQGIAVTGIQMVNAYAAIANKGVLMQPHIVSKIVGSDGRTIRQAKPTPIGRPITEKTASDLVFMLCTVTRRGGTGRRARFPGYEVAGKTGTAQMAVPGGYSATDYTASFVGFFPARDPRICILVALEAPKPRYHGGTVAAPVFARIGAATARYLEIPPDHPDEIIE
ncbi:MAG: peptidoglycan D,D-transpeptidase FtsI family protein [Kiritimatiellia bacterium]|jgi:cell division protein FtsI/penicillin-binding protein 2